MISDTTQSPRRPWPGASAERLLSLAAAPTFAVMALLSATTGGGALEEFCSRTGSVWFGGMMPMYLLMSTFHSAPWLRLIAKMWRNLQASVRPAARRSI